MLRSTRRLDRRRRWGAWTKVLLGLAAGSVSPSVAQAATYVKSVEYVEIAVSTGSATVNLTKSQNAANCVPFASAMAAGTASLGRVFGDVSLTAGSPPTVTVQRGQTGGTLTVGVYVVEFDPVYVQGGI